MNEDKRPSQHDHHQLVRQNARTGLIVMAVVFGMVGVAFASVPLYDLFCRVTGFGGTTQVAATLPETISDRTVTIRFDANTGRNMPWNFKPEIREIKVRLGEKGITSFYAHNRLSKTTGGTALYISARISAPMSAPPRPVFISTKSSVFALTCKCWDRAKASICRFCFTWIPKWLMTRIWPM